MGLTVRVSHPLGESVVQLEPRASDRPVVIGRLGQADVQIPLASVSRRHCLMFVHEGRWVVKDGGSRGGTFVNGRRIVKPTFVNAGDRIVLGEEADAAVIAIEPEAPAAVVEPPEAAGVPAAAEAEDTVIGDLAAAVSPAAGGRFYVPKEKRPSSAGMTAGVLVAVAILGVAGVVLYQMRDRLVEQPKAKAAVRTAATRAATEVVEENPAASIFTPGAGAAAVPTTGAAVAATLPDAGDARDEEWQAVEEAHRSSGDPAIAIFMIEDYRSRHPDTPRGRFLDAYVEAAVDQLWWLRVKELCEERDRLAEEIRGKDKELSEVSDEEARKQFAGEKQALVEQQQVALDRLAELKYGGPAPNTYDPGALGKLRQARDPAVYVDWKKRVVRSVVRSRGLLPWQQGR
jgi:hypothetical protein